MKYSLNILLVYEILALKFIFGHDRVKNLYIMNKWEVEKKKWTVPRIQRFGFVTVHSNFLTNSSECSIDFIHKTYADYLVAKFIFENVFIALPPEH